MRALREVVDSGSIGEVRLVTLDTFRTSHARGVAEWTPDWRRIRKYSGGGIAMDHGSHTFYLVFDWLGRCPSAITAKATCEGAYDTEDNFSCTVTFPTGVAMVRLTWNAAVRKVIYTLHGERGAVKLEDDDLEIIRKGEPVERRSIPSHWMDVSHARWFGSLLDRFLQAIDQGEYVGEDARDAALCVRLIEAGYRSAAADCLETHLQPPAAEVANVAQ
jgi:predicted dehydrogenase